MNAASLLIGWLIHDPGLDHVRWQAQNGIRYAGGHGGYELHFSVIHQIELGNQKAFAKVIAADVPFRRKG